MTFVRRWFAAGILGLAPIAITLYVAYRIFDFLDGLSGKFIYPYTGYIPGLGLLFTVGLVLVFGILVDNFLGRYVWGGLERVISRAPVISGLYDAIKQVVSAIFDKENRSFKRVVLAPFPSSGAGARVLGFVVNERAFNGRMAVFVPFVPPASGLLLYVDPEEVESTELTVEEAMKAIMSGGVITPERLNGRAEAGER